MAKQNILIVDSDPESVKVLEVSLKKAGYSVTKSNDGLDALEMVGFSAPDLIISDTKMPNLDGFGLCTKLKEKEETSHIPFIFLTAEKSIEDKVRGLELGVEDYLNKPIFIREILVRVNLALQRRQKESLENRAPDNKSKFSGSLQDMGVVDLLQTIDLGHKSGVIHLIKIDDTGQIYFKDGQVIDAETETRKGADAVYRMLVWSEGEFEIEFVTIDREQKIDLNTQGLLMEGMRRLDEWGRLQEQLPPLTSVFDVDEDILAERLGEIPDEVNMILRHFDGKSPLMEVVNRSGLGDLEALTVITKLFFEGLIIEVPPMPTIPAPAETEALLSEESMSFKAPSDVPSDVPSKVPAPMPLVDEPPTALPSRVVDNALGPHLSIAASDPLGFVRALTQSVPPIAPPMEDDLPEASEAPSEKASSEARDKEPAPKEPAPLPGDADEPEEAEETEAPPKEEPVKKVGIAKIATIKKPVSIPNVESEHETMLGMARPEVLANAPTEAAPAPHEVAETDALEPDDISKMIDPRETRTLTSKEFPDPKEIAAAIDAEIPPPEEETVSEDSTSTSTSGFFDGASYKASFNPRPSYDPETDKAEPPEEARAEDVTKDDAREKPSDSSPSYDSEAPEGYPEDEDEDDPWDEDEMDDAPSVPSNMKPLFAIVAILVIAGIVGAIWFFMTDDTPVAEADGKSDEKTEEVAAAPLIQKTETKPAEEARTDPKPADPRAPNQAAVEKQPGEGEEPASAAAAETAGDGDQAQAADAISPKALSDEDKKKVEKLMATANRAGKAKKLKLLKEVLTLDATNDEALAMLSIELLERKQTRDEAEDYAKRALAVNPGNAMAWLAAGYIHQLNGNADEAKKAYSRCSQCSGPAKYVRECRNLAK